jgi:hypothetical protein
MNTHKVTPKDFFLWAGAMVGLYGSVVSFITLIFAYIDQAFPDALSGSYYYNYDPYSGSIRFAMASLIVLVPVTILLLNLIRKDIVLEHAKADLWVRRWALFLTLFLAGLAMVIDLITLINYFLGGELTTRFVLKVATILLVAAGVFMHFLADYWGYWIKFPSRARSVGIAAAVLVLLSIVSGFFIIGSPAQVRLQRFDSQKVTDLQNIQWQIINYYQTKGALPANLDALKDPISNNMIPQDPQTNADYVYRVTTAPYSFELCATFNTDSTRDLSNPSIARPYPADMGVEGENWSHAVGEKCFSRTIDPERYPVYPKGTPTKI